MANKAVFFDRDGTLNVDAAYLWRIDEFRWIDGAMDAIRYCNEKGYLAIVITNQSGVARGYFPEEKVHVLHNWMNEELAKHGAHIDAFYFCPHHPEGTVPEYRVECECRKPKPGMVETACRQHDIDKSLSLMVGDMERDVECGRSAGVRSVLFTGGNLLKFLKKELI